MWLDQEQRLQRARTSRYEMDLQGTQIQRPHRLKTKPAPPQHPVRGIRQPDGVPPAAALPSGQSLGLARHYPICAVSSGAHDTLTTKCPSPAVRAINAPASAVNFTPNSSSKPLGESVFRACNEALAAPRTLSSASSNRRVASTTPSVARLTRSTPEASSLTSNSAVDPSSSRNRTASLTAAPLYVLRANALDYV